MNKTRAVLFVFLLAAASCIASSSAVKAYPNQTANFGAVNCMANSSPPQLPTKQETVALQQTQVAKSSPLPSPFVVAAWIVGLVAFFGALISIYLHGRRGNKSVGSRVVERFWAIDFYGAG
ncbi:MAG: hypothetical protein ABSG33_00780 [Candidatus Bathyarchaeia archaeon]|jgi:hypothetical protein